LPLRRSHYYIRAACTPPKLAHASRSSALPNSDALPAKTPQNPTSTRCHLSVTPHRVTACHQSLISTLRTRFGHSLRVVNFYATTQTTKGTRVGHRADAWRAHLQLYLYSLRTALWSQVLLRRRLVGHGTLVPRASSITRHGERLAWADV